MLVLEHQIRAPLHEIAVKEPKLLGHGPTVQLQDAFLPFRMDGCELLDEPVQIGLVPESKAVDGNSLLPAFWGDGSPRLGANERGDACLSPADEKPMRQFLPTHKLWGIRQVIEGQ